MSQKRFVTLRSPGDAQAVEATGCEVLARYPDGMLVRCTDEQESRLEGASIESTVLQQPPVQVSGAQFEFGAALAANEATPVAATSPDRLAYYLVQLVGPAKGEWLEFIRSLGGVIHGNLPGYSLLVGILPGRLDALGQQSWVEGVTPYRPAMKVSPKLRPGVDPHLDFDALSEVLPAAEPQQVEVSVFPGENGGGGGADPPGGRKRAEGIGTDGHRGRRAELGPADCR